MGKLFNAILLLLALFFEIAVLLCSCQNSTFSCIEGERQALLKFKQSFRKPSDDEYSSSPWSPSHALFTWEGKNCCMWKGVSCDKNTGHVVKLNLRANRTNHLEASGVNSCLLELKYLEYLDLSGNDFKHSIIPQFFGLMKHLIYLDVSWAGFSGTIPRNLGNLTGLRVLSISSGLLELDHDVQWISGLAALQHLRMDGILLHEALDLFQVLNMLPSLKSLSLRECNLDNSHLSWLIPVNSSLQYLDLVSNNFGGQVPSALQNMTSLKFLDLSYNLLNSSIPKWFGNFKNLVHLNLASNNFSSIENGLLSILGDLCYLKLLDLSYNQLRGDNFGHYQNLSGCLQHDLETLSLEHGGISGHISDGMGMLKNIKYLHLYRNHLYGTIPDSFGQLVNLETLDLSHSYLFGGIPESLGQLPNLEILDLSHNQLNGTIPESLGQLSKLQTLHLSHSHLYGAIPGSLGKLSNMRNLDLSRNQLKGSIPESLGLLSNLESLNLNYNSLEGVVSEVHFATLSKLKLLHICKSNRLTIKIKSGWAPPFQLKHINLESCKFASQLPQWLRTQSQATTLILSNTSIFGTLPKWIKDMNLSKLDLSRNHITGNLPNFSSKLKHLDLSNNLLSGTLTHMINDNNMLPELQVFNLSNNLVNGSIPKSFCRLRSLKVFKLSLNKLSGNIPDCWTRDQDLLVLDLSSNNLSGVIPNSFGNLPLLSLHLGDNNLSGELPLALKKCVNLLVLDLGENALSGPVPEWLGEDRMLLLVLRLRQNKFSRSIPSQIYQTSLQILDLADNNLKGTIPACFGKFGTIRYFTEKHELEDEHLKEVMKGIYLEYTKTLKYLVSIDLSRNKLTGSIPKELTLSTALISLNLSHNWLSGKIPENIGALERLESLDLSLNDLSGKIPDSMSSITTLSYLNLSYNNLSGKIPTGNQLQTLDDPSIYDGNTLLCGTPLPKKCWDDKPQPHQGNEATSGKQNSTEKMWFYVVIMCGFATGFWGVFGVLVFKKSWRHAYFSLVDRSRDWVLMVLELKMASLKNTIKGNRAQS